MSESTMRASVLARVLVFGCLVLLPLRIVGSGYLPDDDAMRHAAKAVSGRPWSDVLVLRPDVTMDSHPGWHALLGLAHRLTGATAPDLLVFSVVVLMLVFLLPPVFALRRPEAWALAVTAFATLDQRVFSRVASGRPFLFSAALLVLLCLLCLGRERAPSMRGVILLAPVFGIVAWMHPSWHLFLIPVAAALLAGERRLAALLAASLAAGVVLAGIIYGHPLEFVEQSVWHTVLAMGSPAPPGTLAIEFLPGDGSPLLVLGAAAFLLWRHARGHLQPGTLTNPVAVLVLGGWLLGFLVVRFWSDWGAVALLAWTAHEIQRALEERMPEDAPHRVRVAAVGGLAALLACSAGLHGGRAAERPYAALTAVEAGPALPDPGGILYTDDMRLFFQVFYSRPRAPFRYIVGYEPALMPPSDLATLRAIGAAKTGQSYSPWVVKMTPRDRLIVQSLDGQPPIPGLQWTQVSRAVWSGRLRPPAAP